MSDILAGVVDGFLGSLLVYASLAKASDFKGFEQSIPSKLIDGRGRQVVAVSLIAAEAVIGVPLLAGLGDTTIVRSLGLVMMLGFTATTALIATLGLDIRCYCFGASDRRVGFADVVRDAALSLMFAIALLLAPKPAPATTLFGLGAFVLLLLTLALFLALKPVKEVAED